MISPGSTLADLPPNAKVIPDFSRYFPPAAAPLSALGCCTTLVCGCFLTRYENN